MISVIIPTYNSGKFISKTLQHILDQTYKDIEIIVADDRSTDNTIELVRMLLQGSSKIIMSNTHTGGPNHGRNLGILQAQGEYIAFCDHDDLWDRTKLLKQLRLIKATKCPICTTGRVILNHVQYSSRTIVGPKSLYGKNETFLQMLRADFYKPIQSFYPSGILITKELAVNCLFSEVTSGLDFDWLLRILENQTTCEVTEPLFIRNVYVSNLSGTKLYHNAEIVWRNAVLKKYEAKYPIEVAKAKKVYAVKDAHWEYSQGNYKKAKQLFMRGKLSIKDFVFFLSLYVCPNYVKSKYHL